MRIRLDNLQQIWSVADADKFGLGFPISVVKMSGRVMNRNRKVKVWARIRPTSNFAHDNLELLPDHKVIPNLRFPFFSVGLLFASV